MNISEYGIRNHMNKAFSEFSIVFACYRRIMDMIFMSSSIVPDSTIPQKSYDYRCGNHKCITNCMLGIHLQAR